MWVYCGRSKVKKGKAAEGRVVAAGNGKSISSGRGDTAALNRCGQDTGESGGVGRPTAYFLILCERYGL